MSDSIAAEAWFAERDEWRAEVTALRPIVLGTGLTETVKWKHPCYTDRGKNVVLIGWRKDCALVSFLKGALVDDSRKRLVQPGQARSGRYLPFTSVKQIEEERDYLLDLIAKAIAVERTGLRVEPLPDEIEMVAELQQRLDADVSFRTAFEALTLGRRRQYNLHFAKAKKASTRESRITQCTERIMMGKGLTDCICGRSQRMPRCDGSHRKP
ncbi:MAG: YdeI/OmpD-associated family protein [Myxococcota bacterium]